MEAKSDNKLVSNHLISDGTEDVVLLDSAATISTDLTEATNEDQKINLRSATADLTKATDKNQKINLRSAKDKDLDNRDSKDSGNHGDNNDDNKDSKDSSNHRDNYDDNDGKKDTSQYDRNRKHETLPASTDTAECWSSR